MRRLRRTPSAPQNAERPLCSLMVHGPEFGAQLVLNPDFFPHIQASSVALSSEPCLGLTRAYL